MRCTDAFTELVLLLETGNVISMNMHAWHTLAVQSREKHDGIGGSDWQSHSEIWIYASELDSPARGRSGVLRSGKRMSSWIILEIHTHGSGNYDES